MGQIAYEAYAASMGWQGPAWSTLRPEIQDAWAAASEAVWAATLAPPPPEEGP
jgi:hypothetical protein